ncbi:hypothetical protein E4U42_004890 [Claviceps africana]|uniref:GED domain-containing protein n=1 Tax=Claviceps africana TaxID=83212 RepID=A0A8K0NJ81_9HYPO|nr:hypothetical protein E4U42_004890 [Claviceps africana]
MATSLTSPERLRKIDLLREKNFDEEPWCHLPRDRVGVAALRERLQDLLGHITDRAFPKLRAEARRMLAECKTSLDRLGAARLTTQQQQQVFLSDMAARFQAMVRGALEANYSSLPDADTDGDSLRLMTNVVNMTAAFNCDFIRSSHDTLKAYYKVARERVVDNLFRQAVDHCLLTGPESPLGLFCEKWVLGLDAQDLASMAGESCLVSRRRERLTAKMQDLESALKILR